MQMKYLISLWMILCACACLVVVRAAELPFVNGAARLSAKLSDGKIVSIIILTSKIKLDNPYRKAFQWGGYFDSPPSYFISSFEEKINSEKIPVSLSAYADLGDPVTCSIAMQKGGFNVVIVGGDAGVSYRAVFMFRKIGGYFLLRQRKVMSGEFPEQRWEETTYSYNTETN